MRCRNSSIPGLNAPGGAIVQDLIRRDIQVVVFGDEDFGSNLLMVVTLLRESLQM
jgi:hypothetical protein